MRFVKNTLWISLSTAVVSVAAVVSQSLLLGHLKEDYDIIVLLVSVTSFMTIASHLGLPIVVTKTLAETERHAGGAARRGKVVSAALATTVWVSLVFMVLLGAGGALTHRMGWTGQWSAWLWICPAWLAGSACLRIGESITNGFQRMSLSAGIRIFQELARLAGVFVLLAAGLTVGRVVGMYAVVALSSVAFAGLLLWRFLRRENVGLTAPSGADCRHLLRSGLLRYYVPYLVSDMVVPLLPLVVAAFSDTPGEVGSFRFAMMMASLIMLPVGALITSALPRMAAAQIGELPRLGSILFRLLGMYTVAAMLLFLYTADFMIATASRGGYTGPIAVVWWLALSRAAACLSIVPDVMLRSRHTAHANAKLELVRFGALAALVPLLTWRMGIMGTAIAFAACSVGGGIAQTVLMHVALKVDLRRDIAAVALPGAVLAAAFILEFPVVWTATATVLAALAGLVVFRHRPVSEGAAP